MVPGQFSVTFDHAQTRTQRHPVMAVVRGNLWNGGVFEDTWLDPVTHTLMLRPMCKYPGWQILGTGIYAKPAFADYEFQTSANWNESEVIVGGGQSFMQGAADSANPGWIRTAVAPGLNRGVNLALFGYGAGDYVEIAQFGWDDSATTYDASAIGVRLFSDGRVFIYKAGVFVADGRIGIGASGAKNVPLELMLLPMRRRELLVLGQGGDGFTAVFDDIDEGEASPVIVPDEKFWLKMQGDTTRAQVQIAPCRFEATGYANSVLVNFQRPPESGASMTSWVNPVFSGITSANVYGDTAYAGSTDVTSVTLVESDGATAFVADGTLNTGRVKIVLEGDGEYTPFIAGAVMRFDGAVDTTDDSESFDVSGSLRSLSISVPDEPFGAEWSLTLAEPDDLDSDIASIRTIGNRPVLIECGGVTLVDGRAGEPEYRDGLHDETKEIRFSVRDLSSRLEGFQFRDEYPLDGYYLSRSTGASAVEDVATLSGLQSSEIDLSDDTYKLPDIPGQTAEEFSYAVPVGETGLQAIEGLLRSFAGNWFAGIRPTATVPQLVFKSPADMGTTPVMTVYRTAAAATGASKPKTQVYQSLRIEAERVNANEVWVTGQNPRTGEIVQAFVVDTASQDATTVPSLRPDNWIGEPLVYGVQDKRFRTYEDCERAITLLSPAVTSKRTFGEFETPEMLWYNSDPGGTDLFLPVWRGDYVTLEDYGDVQITSFTVDILRNADGAVVTAARYTFGGFTNAGGRSLLEIQESNRARYDSARMVNPFGLFGNGLAARTTRTEAP